MEYLCGAGVLLALLLGWACCVAAGQSDPDHFADPTNKIKDGE